MPRTAYVTATTLDGFIADPDHRLDWLLRQDVDEQGPLNHAAFMDGVGAIVMGSSTYEWVLRHLLATGEPWPYRQPSWVMTTRELTVPEAAEVRFARGDVAPVHAAAVAAAAGRDVWVVGGGELAGLFADAGLLDEVVVSIAPVVLGAGAPLLPRRLDLRLLESDRNRDLVVARYAVDGPLLEDRVEEPAADVALQV